MNQYAFILGRYPELSSIEIFCVLKKLKIKFEVDLYRCGVLVISSDNNFGPEQLINILGGTVKIVRIICPFTTGLDLSADLNVKFNNNDFLNSLNFDRENKIRFGLSVIGQGKPSLTKLSEIAQEIKILLNKKNIKAGFVQNKTNSLNSASVVNNKLLEKGFELVIFTDCGLIGKTVAVQPFEQFSRRDYERPAKDLESGMITPKLARMMLNIGGLNHKTIYLDPFCGSGTFVQEALLLKAAKIYAFDISPKAVESTKINTQWLINNFNLDKPQLDIQIRDVLDLPRQKIFVDLIACEPYLGPAQVKYFSSDKLRRQVNILQNFYLQVFSSFFKILGPKGKVVLVLPIFQIGKKQLTINILPQIKNIGFRQIYLTSQEFIGKKIPEFSTQERGSLIYGRSHQTVLREVFVFEKN